MTFRPPSPIWHPRILCLLFFLNTFIWTFLFFHPSSFHFFGSYSADDELELRKSQPSLEDNTSTSPSNDEGFKIPSYIEPTPEDEEAPTSSHDSNTTSKWSFDPARDSKAWSLTDSQCDIAFPGLFTEIERAVACRKTIGQVKLEEIDISSEKDVATGGVVRAMIKDQQLYIIEAHISNSDHPRMRALAILHSIHRALITSPTPLPDIEFSFSANDRFDTSSSRPIWTLTRRSSSPEKWIMSDFGYWAWSRALIGGYEEMRLQISELEKPWEEKIPKVVWRGDRKNNPNRVRLIELSEGKEWADVRDIQWRDARHITGYDADKTITVPEHCLWQFVIQTEGWSYSGRGKYLQNCNSVVIIPKRVWIEPQHALLVSSGPLQNFVEIEEDYSDLESVMEELLANPEKAKMIAQNGVDTFRDRALTPAAQACYWRKMLAGWAEVSPKAERWEHVAGARIGKRRGVDFETYAVREAMPKRGCTWGQWFTFKC